MNLILKEAHDNTSTMKNRVDSEIGMGGGEKGSGRGGGGGGMDCTRLTLLLDLKAHLARSLAFERSISSRKNGRASLK